MGATGVLPCLRRGVPSARDAARGPAMPTATLPVVTRLPPLAALVRRRGRRPRSTPRPDPSTSGRRPDAPARLRHRHRSRAQRRQRQPTPPRSPAHGLDRHDVEAMQPDRDGDQGRLSGAPLQLLVRNRVKTRLEAPRGARGPMTRTTQRWRGVRASTSAAASGQGRRGPRWSASTPTAPTSTSRGFHILKPASIVGWTDDIVDRLDRLATAMRTGMRSVGLPQANYYTTTGIKSRTDLGTLNLSDVPAILVECGNMKNSTRRGADDQQRPAEPSTPTASWPASSSTSGSAPRLSRHDHATPPPRRSGSRSSSLRASRPAAARPGRQRRPDAAPAACPTAAPTVRGVVGRAGQRRRVGRRSSQSDTDVGPHLGRRPGRLPALRRGPRRRRRHAPSRSATPMSSRVATRPTSSTWLQAAHGGRDVQYGEPVGAAGGRQLRARLRRRRPTVGSRPPSRRRAASSW